jgi:hypothetical protein
MTEVEAKELLIDLINYAAYRETLHSLWPTDMNRLYGTKHYPEDRPDESPSVWEGEQFESKMAELLKWGVSLGSAKGDWRVAVRALRGGNHYLNRIIQRAGLADV